MKRDKSFGVWTRCNVCGTIFPDRAELQEHAAKHAGATKEPEPVDYTALDDEPQILPIVKRSQSRHSYAPR
jgi:hypothetical protein